MPKLLRFARARSDNLILGLALGLTVFGLIMLWSASSPLGYARFGSSYYFLKHQFFYGVVPGLILLFLMKRLPYQIWKRLSLPLLLISIVLLVLVFVPGIRAEFGTARSWLHLGSFTIQPSEIVKLTFLFYLAAWLETRGERAIRQVQTGLLPFLVLLGLVMGLLLAQPDTGSMAIIVLPALVVYFVAGSSIRHLAFLALGGFVLLGALIKLSPYRAARLMTFVHPELDPQGVGYHINQALLAVGSGGWFGLGLGHSRQKFEYLPEVQSDSIFAVMAEELGFLFVILILTVFFIFVWRGLQIAERAPDQFGRFVAVGIVSWIMIQTLVNIGAMIGILPLTGVPLPFISFGGTALTITLASVGVLLNISKNH